MILTHHRNDRTGPAIAWEESACLLCGNSESKPLFEAADPLGEHLRFLIVQCKRCGLCFTNPRPDAASIAQFYPRDYPCHHGKHRPPRRDFVCTPPGCGPARLLDFGCGGGDYLRRMHALGWTVTGLDVAPAAVERTRGFGLAAQLGTLPSLEWSESCFEAITFWQSLEHTHQPLEVLSNAFRLLSTGGKLFVTVPNFDSFGARWFGAAWYGLDVPRHLIHFTPNTLRLMLMLAGFRDIAIVQQQHNSWIRHSARRHGRSIFATRFASSIAGAWARWRGRAEGILAMAVK